MKAQFLPLFNFILSQPQLNSISTKLRVNLISTSASISTSTQYGCDINEMTLPFQKYTKKFQFLPEEHHMPPALVCGGGCLEATITLLDSTKLNTVKCDLSLKSKMSYLYTTVV